MYFNMRIDRSDITNLFRCLITSEKGHLHDTGYLYKTEIAAAKAGTKYLDTNNNKVVNVPTRRWA